MNLLSRFLCLTAFITVKQQLWSAWMVHCPQVCRLWSPWGKSIVICLYTCTFIVALVLLRKHEWKFYSCWSNSSNLAHTLINTPSRPPVTHQSAACNAMFTCSKWVANTTFSCESVRHAAERQTERCHHKKQPRIHLFWKQQVFPLSHGSVIRKAVRRKDWRNNSS